jgi:hypothetical protein
MISSFSARGDVTLRRSVAAIALALLLIGILILAAYYQLGDHSLQHLKVVDVGSICNTKTMLTYVTLQGIINRATPRIYFIYDWKNGWTDRQWLLETIVPAGYTYENVSDPMTLIEEFRSEISGYVVIDPNINATINIATMICGLTNSVAATPEMTAQLRSSGLNVVEDLRGRWNSDLDAYRWAFQNLYSNCTETALASLDPADMQLRDYLVAQKVFTFWLNSKHDAPFEEQALLDNILASKPSNIHVLGWWNEEQSGVQKASEHGKYVLATDLAPNLSVHSKIEVTLPLKQRDTSQQEKLDPNKIYIAFAISDGDNVQYCMNQMREPLWDDNSRGKLPLGWTISPSLLDLAPGIMKWYYQSATPNDYFICGPSGVGYTYPDSQSDMNQFLNHSDVYCTLSDLHTIWTLGAHMPGTLEKMASSLNDVSSLFLEYGALASSYQAPYLTGTKLIVPCCVWSDNVNSTILEIRKYADSVTSRPLMIFVGATPWNMTPSMLATVMTKLREEEEFEFVRPDQFVNLALKFLISSSS